MHFGLLVTLQDMALQESLGLILRGTCMSVQHFMTIIQMVVEMFQFEPNRQKIFSWTRQFPKWLSVTSFHDRLHVSAAVGDQNHNVV